MNDLLTKRHTLKPEELRHSLTQAGLRYTRQRQAVYDMLSLSTMHPTAFDVFEDVKQRVPRISLATVYKSLDALVDCGLVVCLPAVGDGPDRFDVWSQPHYHLRCLKTGAVDDISTPFDEELLAKLDPGLVDRLRDHGFEVTGYRLEVVGFLVNHESHVADAATEGGADHED